MKSQISLALILTLVFSTTVKAQDKTGEIDKIFNWATPTTLGCACAVSQNGKEIINRFYGLADLERNISINQGTIFDIGSTRKQFVAAAILLLVEDKRLSLSDNIHEFIPELPNYGHKITLDHLLTHTSGLRDWTGLLPLANGNPNALTIILRQRGLNFIPGEEWSYSNSGYVLLTEIVARSSGMTFAEFARKRLFEPLGMKSTTYINDLQDVVKNRALAYRKDESRWKLDMLLGNDRGGAGALLSSAGDLLIWNDALTNNLLGTFVSEKLQEAAKLNNGRKLSYARGLLTESYRGTKEVWHSGSAAGYHSWIGRYPEQGLSIALLCNSDAVAATALAHRVADLFLTAGSQETETGPPPALTGDALLEANNNAGLYFNEQNGESLRLAVDRGRFRVAGGPGLVSLGKDRLRRWGTTVWFMSQDAFEMHFLSPDAFELKSMEGQTTRYRRARTYTPSEADLKGFVARYQSEEIGAFFDIVPGKDALKVRANDMPGEGLIFKPIDDDTFQLAGITLHFLRDKAGKVVALNYSNPVVKNIKFTLTIDSPNSR